MSTTVASLPRADGDPLARETAFARIRQAEFVFAGPGSPSYAIRHWSGTPVPRLFAEKLESGGALVLASAAALTVGRLTVPVYEIYKAGDEPHWLPGLDVLATTGISAAVIPHYDNGEGGDHDTRFGFLGELRLKALEEQLPDDVFILGIDEHTAVILDLDTDRAAVMGRGGLTVRRHGQSEVFAAGQEVPLDALRNVERRPGAVSSPRPTVVASDADRGLVAPQQRLDDLIGRAGLVGPLLETALDVRRSARANGDFATADAIRDRLLALGIVISDASDGTADFRLPSDTSRPFGT